MLETRTLSEHYAEMGRALIEREPLLAPIRESQAIICYLSSDRAKRSHGRPVLGECEKIRDRDKWAVPCDFTVTVYEPNCAGMDEEHLSRLLLHELLHVGIDADEDGNERYSVRPHDLEDFRECCDRWGADWIAS